MKSSENTKLYKEEVLQRFIEFGQSKFGTDHGWQKKYAEALEMKQQQMSDILSMRSPIGAKIREKMQTLLGCDTMWLITGNTKEELDEKLIAMRKRIAAEEMTKDVREMLEILRKEGINTAEPLKEIFDNYRKMQDIIANSTALQSSKTKKRGRGK
ncbi:MAG: hypothetical protein JXB49_31350 [Bacteroidales bacterium]|nr:hypothetical protein [Bacteroidales bacterium]